MCIAVMWFLGSIPQVYRGGSCTFVISINNILARHSFINVEKLHYVIGGVSGSFFFLPLGATWGYRAGYTCENAVHYEINNVYLQYWSLLCVSHGMSFPTQFMGIITGTLRLEVSFSPHRLDHRFADIGYTGKFTKLNLSESCRPVQCVWELTKS